MCSIGEEDFGDEGGAHTMPIDTKIPPTFVVSEICKKCNERNVVVKLSAKDAQCEDCFFQYVRHKFRASMGATRLIERGERVLLIFDGTIECCVMFDMVQYALSQERFKRLTIEPIAVYIDNNCISGKLICERKTYLKQTFEILTYFQFKTYYTSIASDSLVDVENAYELLSNPENTAAENVFMKKLNAIDNHTAKEDFYSIARSNKIRQISSQIGCNYVFVSTISHQIAVNLLVNVALGRGNSVANDISFCDNRTDCTSKILRPMRTINSMEIDTYVRLNVKLDQLIRSNDYLNKISIITDASPDTSIQELSRRFIGNLQDNFDSTVSTVFRTGDKISTSLKPSNMNKNCKFCHSNLDYENSATLFAVEYSRCISACVDQNEVNNINLLVDRANDGLIGRVADNETEKIEFLCHGCRNIFRNLDSIQDYLL